MIRVLWFDDQNFDGFIGDAYDMEIDIDQVNNLSDGLLKLRQKKASYDLLLFDANYCFNSSSPSQMILADTIKQCEQYSNKDIPWLVFTAGEGFAGAESLQHVVPSSDWRIGLQLPLWYSKHDDASIDALLADIPRVVEYFNSPRRALKARHKDIFALFDCKDGCLDSNSETDLLELLEVLDTPERFQNQEYFNKIRQFLAGPTLTALKELGVVPALCSLNDSVRHLVKREWQSSGITNWVQQAWSSLVPICQDASHDSLESGRGGLQVIQSIKDGYAPYLLRSCIYELLNILTWLHHFAVMYPDAEVNRYKFQIDDTPTADDLQAIVGTIHVIHKDQSDNYYCGKCLLPSKAAAANLGRTVIITEVNPNSVSSTKRTYPYFAKFTVKTK